MPTACPPGTYGDNVGNKNISDCSQCPPGLFCSGYASIVPSGVCDDGYYCPGGQNSSTPRDFSCPAGFFCEAGDAAPRLCLSGTYQDEQGQSTCKLCEPGYFCDSTIELLCLTQFVQLVISVQL